MEKVIQEFRVIETDDGYRIEIKGDKDKLKQHFRGPRHRHHGGWPRGFAFRGGPFGMHVPPFNFGMGPMMWMHGQPFDIEFDVEDEDEDTEPHKD